MLASHYLPEDDRQPNLFIVGAARAGTTTIHDRLCEHPSVWMSRVKEPHYYADVRPEHAMRHLIKRLDRGMYLDQFSNGQDLPWRGDASPSYLWDSNSARRIARDCPQAHIIIVLRDPLQRTISHYWGDVREGIQSRPLAEALEHDRSIRERSWGNRSHLYVDLSLYAAQVERYLNEFPREQVLITEFSRLRDDPSCFFRQIAEFLRIPASQFGHKEQLDIRNAFALPRGPLSRKLIGSARLRTVAQRVFPVKTRRWVRGRLLISGGKPEIDPQVKRDLLEIFEADVKALEVLVGCSLPSLRESWSR